MSETQNKKSENLPTLRPPRLPYHPIIQKEFGYDENAWKALVEAIFPSAKTPEAVRLALSYCKARNLDPFKRCIHIVPIWDSTKRCEVDTVWPGIGELRTTAHRTGDYAGRDKTEFGPIKEETWKINNNDSVTVLFPEWAQVTVYRMVKGNRVAYAGPQVYWIETFGSSKSGAPNSMWRKRPRGQIDKCAEAAALRAAFPEEIGNDYIDAEAHDDSRQIKSYEATEEAMRKQIDAEQGTDPIDADFAPPAEPQEQEKPTKKRGRKSKKKKEPETLYICKCGHGFDKPRISGEGPTQVSICPKCFSKDIKSTADEKPEWADAEDEQETAA